MIEQTEVLGVHQETQQNPKLLPETTRRDRPI